MNNPRNGGPLRGLSLEVPLCEELALFEKTLRRSEEHLLFDDPPERNTREGVGANPVFEDPTASQARDLSSLAAVFHTKNTQRVFPSSLGRSDLRSKLTSAPQPSGGAQPESIAPSIELE